MWKEVRVVVKGGITELGCFWAPSLQWEIIGNKHYEWPVVYAGEKTIAISSERKSGAQQTLRLDQGGPLDRFLNCRAKRSSV